MRQKLLIQIQYSGEDHDREDEASDGNLCCRRSQPEESFSIKK